MAQAKRIAVNVPEDLLASIDDLVDGPRRRSAFVREALRLLIRQRQRVKANLDRLRRGYEQMGRINLELAEEGIRSDLASAETYERTLSERDKD